MLERAGGNAVVPGVLMILRAFDLVLYDFRVRRVIRWAMTKS